MGSKRISRKQIIEAARKNGFIHARNSWFTNGITRVSNGTAYRPIVQACFMGQIALNLGVDHMNLIGALNSKYGGLGHDILRWNDEEILSYEQILALVEERMAAVSNPPIISAPSRNYIAQRKDGTNTWNGE